jgi:hypothetical protein
MKKGGGKVVFFFLGMRRGVDPRRRFGLCVYVLQILGMRGNGGNTWSAPDAGKVPKIR